MAKMHTLDADFVVVGGGMAGVCAALAAARRGLRTVLIQDRSVLGGNASSEIRMHICGADNHGHRQGWRESGLIEELRIEDAVRNPARCYPFWDVLLYEKVVSEPTLTLLLDTAVVGVEMSTDSALTPPPPAATGRLFEYRGARGRITAVKAVRTITEDEFRIRGRYFADCSGDGRLGAEAGADHRIGRESQALHGESLAPAKDDRHTLGSSILITSRKHDQPVPFVAPPWARQFDAEKLKVGRGIGSWEYGFWWIEWGGLRDTLKEHSTTIRHELYAIALGIWDYIKNSGKYPDSANWALDWIGAVPGKRESRRFLGPHILTQQDILEARRHADEVAYGGWSIDLHPPAGVDAINEPPCSQHHAEKVYGIPLRSYFSRNIDNLFFAGRNISATHTAFASTRVMATCAVGGEAVGAAAAYCLRNGLASPAALVGDPSAVAALQEDLLRHDATLPNVLAAPVLVQRAEVTASSSAPDRPASLVLDGVTRDLLDEKTGALITPHAWHSAPLASDAAPWLELTWPEPVTIREIRLTFDSGFQRQLTLTASDWCNKNIIRGAQPETVADYTLSVDGQVVDEITGNYQRFIIHQLDEPRRATKVRLTFTRTQGAPEVRVFAVRVE